MIGPRQLLALIGQLEEYAADTPANNPERKLLDAMRQVGLALRWRQRGETEKADANAEVAAKMLHSFAAKRRGKNAAAVADIVKDYKVS